MAPGQNPPDGMGGISKSAGKSATDLEIAAFSARPPPHNWSMMAQNGRQVETHRIGISGKI